MGWITQLFVVLLALLTSVGIAGIPSAGLVAILVILQAVGFDDHAPLYRGWYGLCDGSNS